MTDRKSLSALLCAAFLAVFASACAAGSHKDAALKTGGPRPSWIEGDGPEFPRARYVTGVGSADDDASAADRARGEVARVFTADITASSLVNESESTSKTNGKEEHSFSQTVAQNVQTATKKVLEGVDIVARWKDPTGRYYALAALEKSQALEGIAAKEKEISNEASGFKDALASAPDNFARAKAAAKLMALARSLTDLAAEKRVLGGGADTALDLGALRASAAKALAALDVVVAVEGEGADAASSAIATGLNGAGLTAKRGAAADKSDVLAAAKISVDEQASGDPKWKRYRAVATVSLQDGRDGKVFSNFDVTAREDATDLGEARRRCLASIAKKTAAQVTSSINDFFANQ